MQEMPVRSWVREDPLEKEMATRSSILTWEIPQTEEPGGLQSLGSKELDMTEQLSNDSRLLCESLSSLLLQPPPLCIRNNTLILDQKN